MTFTHPRGTKRTNPKSKKCTACSRFRLVKGFSKDVQKKDGLNTKCDACISKRNKADYAKRKITNPKRKKARASNDEYWETRAI